MITKDYEYLLPESSRNGQRRVNQLTLWGNCYDRFVRRLFKAAMPGRLFIKEVLEL